MRIDYNKVMADSAGRWLSIYSALGIEVREDGKHGRCPICHRDGKMRVDDKDGRGTWICTCSAGDGFKLVQEVLGVDFTGALEAVGAVLGNCERRAPRDHPRITPDDLRKMFLGGVKCDQRSLMHKYLAGRGLSVFPTQQVWFNKIYESETKQYQNAMIAVFTMPDGRANCVHRTYLDADGQKLDIESPRKMTPSLTGKISGGAIRLFDVDGEKTMGIAEGIETALAGAEDFKIPFWSAVNASLLKSWVPPDNIEHIVVLGDNDRTFTGQAAAYALAKTIVLKHKKTAEVFIPARVDFDWLDQLNEAKRKL